MAFEAPDPDPNGSPDWDAWTHELNGLEHGIGSQADAYDQVDPAFLPRDIADDMMDASAPAPTVEGESAETIFAEVHARIMDEVVAGVAEEHFGESQLGPTIAGLAIEAADAGDAAAVETYVERISQLQVDDVAFAYACAAGVRTGSDRAMEILSGALDVEKNTAETYVAAWKNSTATYYVDPHDRQLLLLNTANTMAEHGLSPDLWIDNYALDDEHRWTVTAAHLRHMAGNAADGDTTYQRKLDAHLAQLADNPSCKDLFVYGQTRQALEAAKDPMLRERLVDQFVESSKTVPLTLETFEELVHVGEQVLDDPDPDVANPAVVQTFSAMIDNAARSLEQYAVSEQYAQQDIPDDERLSPAKVAEKLLRWKAGYARHVGEGAQGVVNAIDAHTSSLMELIADGGATTHAHDVQTAGMASDYALGNFAEQYAEQGDFTAANTLLAAVFSGDTKAYLLSKCLDMARTPEQVAAISPDPLTLEFDPGLQLQTELAAVRVSGNVNLIIEKGMECAAAPRSVGSTHRARLDFMHDAYNAIAATDGLRALAFARDALATMRATGYRYSETVKLSAALIAAGDSDEVLHAYEAANATHYSSDRLACLWQLAHTIEGTEPPIV